MAKVVDIDPKELEEWLATRPLIIRELAAKCPPDRLYRMKSTGQRVTIVAYSEAGTVRVNVTGQFNVVTVERSVSGVSVDDLEECDLPTPGEKVGAVLTDAEVAAALVGAKTPDERMKALEKAAFEKARSVGPVLSKRRDNGK